MTYKYFRFSFSFIRFSTSTLCAPPSSLDYIKIISELLCTWPSYINDWKIIENQIKMFRIPERADIPEARWLLQLLWWPWFSRQYMVLIDSTISTIWYYHKDRRRQEERWPRAFLKQYHAVNHWKYNLRLKQGLDNSPKVFVRVWRASSCQAATKCWFFEFLHFKACVVFWRLCHILKLVLFQSSCLYFKACFVLPTCRFQADGFCSESVSPGTRNHLCGQTCSAEGCLLAAESSEHRWLL